VITTCRGVNAGHWSDLAIGALLLPVWMVIRAGSIGNWLRRQRRSPQLVASADPQSNQPASAPGVLVERCGGLVAEALIVRDRVSGQIDTATYPERVNELVSKGRS
jgi:hypothetical protein